MGAPVDVSVVSGSNQATVPSTAFAQSLVVLVRDADSVPQAGIVVSFVAPVSGASCTLPATAITDALGKATVAATANATVGTYGVTASYAGATSAVFVLRNAPAISVTTPYLSPTIAEQTTAPAGAAAWSNQDLIKINSGTGATCPVVVGTPSRTLNGRGFGHTIPAGATVTTVFTRVRGKATAASGTIYTGYTKPGGSGNQSPFPISNANFNQYVSGAGGAINVTVADANSPLFTVSASFSGSGLGSYALTDYQLAFAYTGPPLPPLTAGASPLLFCEA